MPTTEEASAIPDECLRSMRTTDLLDDDEVMSQRESDVIVEETIEETLDEPMEPSSTCLEEPPKTTDGVKFYIDSQEDDLDRDLGN